MMNFLKKNYLWKGHRDNLQKKVSQGKFQTGFVVAGVVFLSFWNHQLIKFEEDKRFGERHKLIWKFSLRIFSLQDIPVPVKGLE